MNNYRLKELRNLNKEKKQVMNEVLIKIQRKKKGKNYTIIFLTTIVSIAIIFFFMYVLELKDTDEFSTINLTEIKGNGVAYSELFHFIDGQIDRELTYFKPMSFQQFSSISNVTLPENNFGLQNLQNEVIIVESKKGVEVQLMFRKIDEENEETKFMSISVSNSEYNPLSEYDSSTIKDPVGNKIEKVPLTKSINMIHQILTTDSALIFNYYDYNEKKNEIGITSTQANELYTYYEGNIYHIGYTLNQPKEDIISFVKQFILLNSNEMKKFSKEIREKH